MNIIGILLDEKVFKRISKKKTRPYDLRQYNKACRENGLTPIYTCLEQVNLSTGRVSGYRYHDGQYKRMKIRIPIVIYNRAMPAKKKMRVRLTRLNQKSFVFNAKTRYSKYKIHQILQKRFKANLPPTRRYSQANLRQMMNRYKNLYVKPQSGSIGAGIVKLSRQARGRWLIQKSTGKQTASKQKTLRKIQQYVADQPYLVQRGIPLAKHNGQPFDLRVVVQRAGDGNWQVTAMLGKVARKGNHVTNAFRGGMIKRADDLFTKTFKHSEEVRHAVERLSLDIARHLGNKIERFSDVGLDIGLTKSGKPYFIEANGRDQRYGLKKINLTQSYYRVHKTPIDYAGYMYRKLGSS